MILERSIRDAFLLHDNNFSTVIHKQRIMYSEAPKTLVRKGAEAVAARARDNRSRSAVLWK